MGVSLVTGAAGVLLHHHGQRVHHHSTGNIRPSTHSTTHTTTNAATDTATHCTATHSGTSSFGTCGSLQLRSGCREHMEGG